jgi:hypothetical protein
VVWDFAAQKLFLMTSGALSVLLCRDGCQGKPDKTKRAAMLRAIWGGDVYVVCAAVGRNSGRDKKHALGSIDTWHHLHGDDRQSAIRMDAVRQSD